MDLDLVEKGLGVRSRRYAMLVDNGTVRQLRCPCITQTQWPLQAAINKIRGAPFRVPVARARLSIDMQLIPTFFEHAHSTNVDR